MDVPAAKSHAPADTTLTTEACSEASRCGNASWIRNTGPRMFTSTDLANALLAERADRLGQRVRRVVDHDVHPTEAIDRHVHQTTNVIERTHVARDPHGIEAERRELGFVAAHASALRLATTRRAPARPNPSATARPIPRVRR